MKKPVGNLLFQIQTHPFSLSEKDVAAYLSAARSDPRLMEVMTEHIRDYWWIHHPVLLNRYCKKSEFPFVLRAVIAVIRNHCAAAKQVYFDFQNWAELAARGIKKPPSQLLYFNIYSIGSRSLRREVKERLPVFFEQGLICKDLPFNKQNPKELGHRPKLTLENHDLIKLIAAQKLKRLKLEGLSNQDILKQYNINRVYLSNLLNNKFEKISLSAIGRLFSGGSRFRRDFTGARGR